MARLDLTKPLTTEQALLHIACGRSRFVEEMEGKSLTLMTRLWFVRGDDGLIPSQSIASRGRLSRLREAIIDELGEDDEFEMVGWSWVWFAKQHCATAIAPKCEANWNLFL